MTDRRDRARVFRALHDEGTFVLANAWDAASAAVMAAAGVPALATTSSGVSWSLGVPDGEHLDRDQMMAAVARIAAAVAVPVSADVESGYGPDLSDVEETVDAVVDAGAVGLNLEDSHGSPRRLFEVGEQCARVAAARQRGDRLGLALTVNARTDIFLARIGLADERLEATLERGRGFAEAGADVLFVPGLTDLDTIGRLVAASPLPVNILLAPAAGPTIAELAAVGVRRVSVGGAVARAASSVADRVTRDLLAGEASRQVDVFSHDEMQTTMAGVDRPPARP